MTKKNTLGMHNVDPMARGGHRAHLESTTSTTSTTTTTAISISFKVELSQYWMIIIGCPKPAVVSV